MLVGVTSSNELAVGQAKESDLWEPTTEAELDYMEAQGIIQQPVIQPQILALNPALAEGGTVRCPHCTTALGHAWCYWLTVLTAAVVSGSFMESLVDSFMHVYVRQSVSFRASRS